MPPLGHQYQPLLHDVLGGGVGDILTIESDSALGLFHDTQRCVQRGGLTCAVGTDQGDDAPLGHLQAHVVDGNGLAKHDL